MPVRKSGLSVMRNKVCFEFLRQSNDLWRRSIKRAQQPATVALQDFTKHGTLRTYLGRVWKTMQKKKCLLQVKWFSETLKMLKLMLRCSDSRKFKQVLERKLKNVTLLLFIFLKTLAVLAEINAIYCRSTPGVRLTVLKDLGDFLGFFFAVKICSYSSLHSSSLLLGFRSLLLSVRLAAWGKKRKKEKRKYQLNNASQATSTNPPCVTKAFKS